MDCGRDSAHGSSLGTIGKGLFLFDIVLLQSAWCVEGGGMPPAVLGSVDKQVNANEINALIGAAERCVYVVPVTFPTFSGVRHGMYPPVLS